MAIYGKQSYEIQHRALKRGIDILVGTPGRIMDHLDRKTLDLKYLEYFILDEADEMLDMGFIDDIEKIFKETNPEKKVLLFSATMSKDILKIAKKYIGDYELIEVENAQNKGENTDQTYFEVSERDKFELLRRVMDTETEETPVIRRYSGNPLRLIEARRGVFPRRANTPPWTRGTQRELERDIAYGPREATPSAIILFFHRRSATESPPTTLVAYHNARRLISAGCLLKRSLATTKMERNQRIGARSL